MSRKGSQMVNVREVTRQISGEILGAFDCLKPFGSPSLFNASSLFIDVDCMDGDVHELGIVEIKRQIAAAIGQDEIA